MGVLPSASWEGVGAVAALAHRDVQLQDQKAKRWKGKKTEANLPTHSYAHAA